MNRPEPIQRPKQFMKRLMKFPMFCGLLAMIFSVATAPIKAQDEYYVNNAILTFPGTEQYPPDIDATNFINNSEFIINFTTEGIVQQFYETWDTANYTNNDLLMVNGGFQFDNQSSVSGLADQARQLLQSAESVSCGSVNDTTDPLLGELAALGFAQCLVNASNILNPGSVDVGVNGLIQFKGTAWISPAAC